MWERSKNRHDRQSSDSFPLRIGKGQAFLDGVFGEHRNIVDVQFVHDVQPVDFHGFRADAKPLGRLFGALTFREELKDLSFPVIMLTSFPSSVNCSRTLTLR